jgi:AbrB family looped-hinge helix DNA binding protein
VVRNLITLYPPKAGRKLLIILELDSKGRLTIPKKLREALNIKRRVLVINAGDHLKVVPLPSDSFEVLEGALDLKKPFKEHRKQAELSAEREMRGKQCPS